MGFWAAKTAASQKPTRPKSHSASRQPGICLAPRSRCRRSESRAITVDVLIAMAGYFCPSRRSTSMAKSYEDLVTKAEEAVSKVKDAELRRVAFEKILDDLLSADSEGSRPPRTVDKPEVSRGR